MKEEVKNLWVAALRSGKYDQARQALFTRDMDRHNETIIGHCCLNVLHMVAKEAGVEGFEIRVRAGCVEYPNPDHDPELGEHDTEDEFVTEDAHLVPPVIEWAGMNTPEGEFNVSASEADEWAKQNRFFPSKPSLIHCNDEMKLDFNQIADVIEKHWEEL